MPIDVHIRWLIRRDMQDVLRIEAESFEQPWCDDDFLACLRQRNCIGMVVEKADDLAVIGFMIYELQKGQLQVLNLAVDPRWRRRGVGAAMIKQLRDRLAVLRRSELLAEVRESNLPAQLFLRSQGFRATHVLREHYDLPHDRTEDGYVMRLGSVLTVC